MIVSIGYERNAHETASPKFAKAVSDLGIKAVVLWMSGTSINPQRGLWDFHSFNACWHAFHDVGMKVILKRMWAPAHATAEGKITYQPYTDGAQSWQLDANGNAIPGSAHFDPNLPCVKDPASVNPDWCTDFATRLDAAYFKPRFCEHFIGWNEPGDGNYWPPIQSLGDFKAAFDRLWSQVYRPSKQAAPNAKFVGPDAAFESDLEALLDRDAATPTFDIISFHAYPPPETNTLQSALDELQKRRDIIDPRRNGRDVWNTEIGDAGAGWIVDYIDQATTVMPYLSFININTANLLFTPESMSNETYKLTPTGQALKELLT